MYLIIFDHLFIRDPNRYYYSCSGEYYAKILRATPEISLLDPANIEEILIYSGAKEDGDTPVKVATCGGFVQTENSLQITYTHVQSTDVPCSELKKRIYGHCVRNELLDEKNFTPILLIIDDTQQYNDIKNGRPVPKFRSFMAEFEEYQKNGDWISIVKKCPDEKSIANSELWDDAKSLSFLSFALSNLAIKSHKKKGHREEKGYDSFFLTVNSRCIELEPSSTMHVSSRAYFYYDLYLSEKKDRYFTNAIELYPNLIESSRERYKEYYRYTKLRQTHFETNRWNDTYKENRNKVASDILNSYRELIDSYPQLNEDSQKKYRKLYQRALFGYAGFSIDTYFYYWDAYVHIKLYDHSIKAEMLSKDQLNEICVCDKYLKQLYDDKSLDDISALDLQDKPNYFDVMYRLAQLQQIKGIVYAIKRKDPSTYKGYFKNSNEYVEKLFAVAKKMKEKNERFNYPHFAKLTKAINLYFLEELEECHSCFYMAREYMLYEEGCIYALSDRNNDAIRVLSAIPEQDNCYNKAQKLLAAIKGNE